MIGSGEDLKDSGICNLTCTQWFVKLGPKMVPFSYFRLEAESSDLAWENDIFSSTGADHTRIQTCSSSWTLSTSSADDRFSVANGPSKNRPSRRVV
jgi:hypothetical protein